MYFLTNLHADGRKNNSVFVEFWEKDIVWTGTLFSGTVIKENTVLSPWYWHGYFRDLYFDPVCKKL